MEIANIVLNKVSLLLKNGFYIVTGNPLSVEYISRASLEEDVNKRTYLRKRENLFNRMLKDDFNHIWSKTSDPLEDPGNNYALLCSSSTVSNN
jgi:hypothetical protein